MARQINRADVPRIYMARLSGPLRDGRTHTQEFGPYLVKSAASAAVTRELGNRYRRNGYADTGWTGEVLSAPVGEWTVES